MSASELRLESSSPQQTQQLAAAISGLLVVGDLLVLTGDLGAGKTCFTQGLGHGLGVTERITSPTFTLAARYRGRLLLHHLDAYRIDTLGEALDLDLPDLLDSGVTVIEWGELLAPVLPEDHLLVSIEYGVVDSSLAQAAVGGDYTDSSSESSAVSDDPRTIRLVGHGEPWTERWTSVQTKVSTALATDAQSEGSK